MTGKTYKVLLCDDERNVSKEWYAQLKATVPSDYEILDPPASDKIQRSIRELFTRQMSIVGAHSDGHSPSVFDKADCVFDEADILVLDYDLLYVDEKNARHTGESLARLARAFSKVRLPSKDDPAVSQAAQVIVVVNQFQEAQFDLSLRGHLGSHADLNLDAALLDRPGLWADPPWGDGFRPWHWQTLYRAVDTQAARQDWVHRYWQKPIVDALGMRDDDINRLTDSAFGFIAPNSTDGQDLLPRSERDRSVEELRKHTFEDFALSRVNRANVAAFADQHVASRFASARIGKWLERLVLGPQDALIDMPHLIQRFPFLLGDNKMELEAWNAAIHEEDFASRLPADCLFDPPSILSRPAVWSHRFENSEFVRENQRTFDFTDVPPFVFLEDTSSFAHIDQARQFRAGHHNAFDRRFAKCLADFTYAPQRRLAFAG